MFFCNIGYSLRLTASRARLVDTNRPFTTAGVRIPAALPEEVEHNREERHDEDRGYRLLRVARGFPRRDTARAMSQENVEIVRAAFEAWNAGDMDALRMMYVSGVVL